MKTVHRENFMKRRGRKANFTGIRDARFYSVKQVLDWLEKLEFDNLQTFQTIFENPYKIQSLEPIEEGFGKGLFVVISAEAIE